MLKDLNSQELHLLHLYLESVREGKTSPELACRMMLEVKDSFDKLAIAVNVAEKGV